MDWGPDQGYLPEPDKYIFIPDKPDEKEATKSNLNYVDGRRYLWAFLGPNDEIYEWVRPKAEAWSQGVRTLAKTVNRYPQSAYAILGMLLQIKWKYLQRNVPGIGSLMGPIEDSIRYDLLPALFGGEEVSANLIEILGHSVKVGGLGIPHPRLSSECVYNTSNAAIKVLLGSLLGGTDLNYVAHKGCIRRSRSDGRKHRELAEKAELTRRKELADGEGLNHP